MKKRFTFLIAALALLMLVVLPGKVWAADETITFSLLGLTNGKQYTTINGTDCTLTFGDGSNDGKYYTTGAAIRVYSGGHMTVSSTTKTIEKIELTFGSGDGSNTITTDVNTYSNGTWQGSAQSSVTFNVGGTSGHRRIASVAITYSSGPITYTVTYDCNGGTSGCPTENPSGLSSGDHITLAAAPTKTHYTFEGWNDGTTTYAAGADYAVTSNVTMTAQWAINTHNITVQGNTHGTVTGFTNPVAYNTEVTLTYTHNNGEYYSATFSSSNVTITGNTFTMPDNDVTITVTETALPVYTVTLSDGGTLTEDHYGAGVTLPNRTGDGIYSFAGWTTSDIATETTTAPAQILTGTYHPTENITLYPVYTRSEGEGEKWQKITDFASVNEGTYALITTTGLAFTGTINSSGHGTVTTDSFSFDNNEATSAPSGTCELTLTAVTDNDDNVLGYTMYNSDHNYLYASKAGSGGLSWHETEDDYWHITNKFYSNLWSYSKDYSDNYAFLRTYSSSGTYTFRTYSSGGNTLNGATFYFVKKVSLSTTYYISTLSSIAVPSFDPESQNFSTASLTVTITANEGCVINYTIDGTDPETSATAITTDSNSATVTVTGTTTIKALAFDGNDFSAVVSQTYTRVYEVVLSSNGVVAAPIEVAAGESTTLTAPSNIPAGFGFKGWTATPSTPSTLVSDTYTPSANVTLYAVFGKEIYGDFKKVASEPSNWSGYYLIVFETKNVALDGSLVDMDVSKNTIDVSIDNSGNIATIATDDVTNASKFMFAPITGGYSIRSASGYYIGRTENKNGLNMNATTPYVNTLSYSSGPVITSSGGPKLLCWSQGGAEPTWKISYYASNQNAIQLYKQEVLSVDGYYIQAYPSNTVATADITIDGCTVIESGAVLDMGEYTLTNNDPANLVIEDGGVLITKSEGVQATVKKNVEGASTWGAEKSGGVDGWYFIASPVNGASYNTAITTGDDNDYDLFMLDWANKKWLNKKVAANSSVFGDGFTRGTGYLYASEAGNTISVAGEIQPLSNENKATVNITKAGWNLIGNPLTCKVTVDCAFSQLNGGSAVTSGTADNTVINPFQGIAVYSENGNETVTFTKAESQAAAAPSNSNSLQMTLAKKVASRGEVSTKVVDNAVVSFNNSKGMPKFNMLGGNAKLYIPQNNEEYAVVFSDRQGDMPLNFKADELGTYTINFETSDRTSLQGIYLIDMLEEQEIDLSVNPSYTFIGSPADRMARFKIVFRNANDDGTSDIFAYQNGNDIIVSGEGELQIFDVMGRMVSRQYVSGVGTINAMPYGVYIFKLNGMTQKIVVR